MDRIVLTGLEFYGFHGVLPEERRRGQVFSLDLTLFLDLAAAGRADDLNATVDYAAVYQLAKKVVEGEAVTLLEAVAERLAGALLTAFPLVTSVQVRVGKKRPPLPGRVAGAAVEVTRTRG